MQPHTKPGIFIWLSLLSVIGMASAADRASTQPLAVNLADIQWGPPGGGNGVPPGTRTARQGEDPLTGGITYYAMFPAGTVFDPHWHTHDEFVAVVQGPLRIRLGAEEHALETGAYVVIPGGLVHSWHMSAQQDAVILVRRAGPADFHFVDAP